MAIAMATISQVSNFYADPVQKSQMSHFAASLPLGQHRLSELVTRAGRKSNMAGWKIKTHYNKVLFLHHSL